MTVQHLPLCECRICRHQREDFWDSWKGPDNNKYFRPLIEPIDIKRLRCIECRKQTIWRDPTTAEYCCTSCGVVINESEILEKHHARKIRTLHDEIKKRIA